MKSESKTLGKEGGDLEVEVDILTTMKELLGKEAGKDRVKMTTREKRRF